MPSLPSELLLLHCSTARLGCCGLERSGLGDRWLRHGLAKPCVFGRRRVCLGRSVDVISSASHRDELGKPTGGCAGEGARAGPLAPAERSAPDGQSAVPARCQEKQRDPVDAVRVTRGQAESVVPRQSGLGCPDVPCTRRSHQAEVPPAQTLRWCCPGVTEPCASQVGKLRQENTTTRQQVPWSRGLRGRQQDRHHTKQSHSGRGQPSHGSSGKGMQQGHERWRRIDASPAPAAKAFEERLLLLMARLRLSVDRYSPAKEGADPAGGPQAEQRLRAVGRWGGGWGGEMNALATSAT